ncbi:MAG: hypothetical protein AAF429_13240 [Pseudomonadota bacterium]
MAKEQYYIDMMSKDWRDFVHPSRIEILEKRIEVSSSATDCDNLPRHPRAGECFHDEESDRAIQVMFNGLKVLYGRYYGSWVNEIIRNLRGVHEPQEELVFHEILKHVPKGGTMLELGAYWGYYSMWFAQSVEDSKVILVEPHSNQLKVAEGNFELNGLNGEFVNGYVGEYPEKKKKIQEIRGGHLPSYTVPGLMCDHGLDHLTVLHADIQGWETKMLEDSRSILEERKIDWVFVSTHGKTHNMCKEILLDVGYREVAEHTIAESASADGLIVMQSPLLESIPEITISKVDGIVKAHG